MIDQDEQTSAAAPVAKVVAAELNLQSLEEVRPCPLVGELELGGHRRVKAHAVESQVRTFGVCEFLLLRDRIAFAGSIAAPVADEFADFGFLNCPQD